MIKKILIIGSGSIGLRHYNIANKLFPTADFIFFRHKKNSKKIMNFKNIFSLKEILKIKPDITVIANPASLHLKFANFLSKNSLNYIIEKPLSNNSVGIKNLIKLSASKNIKPLLAYNLRFLPSLIFLKSIIDKKYFGKIYSIQARVGSNLVNWRKRINYKNSVSSKKILGGGALLELSHEIDYLLWIFGNFVEVSSLVEKKSNLQIDTEDNAFINFKIGKSKILGSLNIDFIRHDAIRECYVICENGTIYCNLISNIVKIYKKNSNKWKTIFYSKKFNSYKYQWEHYLTCLKNNNMPISNLETGLNVIKIIELIKKSSIDKKTFIIQK